MQLSPGLLVQVADRASCCCSVVLLSLCVVLRHLCRMPASTVVDRDDAHWLEINHMHSDPLEILVLDRIMKAQGVDFVVIGLVTDNEVNMKINEHELSGQYLRKINETLQAIVHECGYTAHYCALCLCRRLSSNERILILPTEESAPAGEGVVFQHVSLDFPVMSVTMTHGILSDASVLRFVA